MDSETLAPNEDLVNRLWQSPSEAGVRQTAWRGFVASPAACSQVARAGVLLLLQGISPPLGRAVSLLPPGLHQVSLRLWTTWSTCTAKPMAVTRSSWVPTLNAP